MEQCDECGLETSFFYVVIHDDAGKKHILCQGCAEKIDGDSLEN